MKKLSPFHCKMFKIYWKNKLKNLQNSIWENILKKYFEKIFIKKSKFFEEIILKKYISNFLKNKSISFVFKYFVQYTIYINIVYVCMYIPIFQNFIKKCSKYYFEKKNSAKFSKQFDKYFLKIFQIFWKNFH